MKVDWHAACISLRVVGTVFLFSWCWHTICTVFQPLRSKGRHLQKSPKRCWPIKSKETWTKYMQLTLLSQCKLTLTVRKTLKLYKIIRANKSISKKGPVSYLGLELTIHVKKMSSKAKSISWDSPFKNKNTRVAKLATHVVSVRGQLRDYIKCS